MKTKYFDMGRKEADDHYKLDGFESISYNYPEYMDLVKFEENQNQLEFMKGYIERANELSHL